LKIYHGSIFIVKNPNLEILNYRTDFGKGFYTTTDIEQAKRWTKIKKERAQVRNKNEKIKRYINIYEYTENKNLNILKFEEATEEWLKFIFKGKFTCMMFIIVQTLCESIKNYLNISYEEAVSSLYHSKLYKALEREETKMWYFSNHDLLKMFLEEKETGNYTVYGG